MIRVELTTRDLLVAANVGIARHIRAIQDNMGAVAGVNFMKPGTWESDIIGAMAELAVSYHFNLCWSGGGGMEFPDVGNCIEVRSIQDPGHRLIVRGTDRYLHLPYVLALYEIPRHFRLLGWIFGNDAKRIGSIESPNERAAAFWVEQKQLRPIDDLLKVLFARQPVHAKAG